MTGQGIFAERIEKLFKIYRRKLGIDAEAPTLSSAHFIRPALSRKDSGKNSGKTSSDQLCLF